ncbi:MAG: thioredoxin domain-containing protein [Deltaproteobacteria bacterium]|nr:thioredoxin domain-containing protein [Deltaproteobacteria bacterium]
MKKDKRATLIFLLAVLALLGVVASSVSLNEHATVLISQRLGVEPESSFCNINDEFNCTAVNQSTWSTVFGVPIAAYGLFYFLLLLGTVLLFLDRERYSNSKIEQVLLSQTTIGVAVSIALFFISKFEIGVLCPTCLAVYAINLFSFIAVITLRQESRGFISALFSGIFGFLGILLGGLKFRTDKAFQNSLFVLYVLLAAIISYCLKDTFSLNYISSFSEAPKWEDEPTQSIPLDLSEGINRDYFRGSPHAPIKIVEFADFECPACQVLYLVLEDLQKRYKDKIFYVYKNYPLDNACNPGIEESFHQSACFAATLARCAGEQGKFWEMANYLFTAGLENDDRTPEVTKEELLHHAVEMSLDADKLKTCLDSEHVSKKIVSDIEDGDKLGLVGTPSIWVNGKALRDISLENFESVFKQILNP